MRSTSKQSKPTRNVGQATLETGNPSAPSRSTPNAIRSSKLTPPPFRFNKKPHDLCDNYLDIHRSRKIIVWITEALGTDHPYFFAL